MLPFLKKFRFPFCILSSFFLSSPFFTIYAPKNPKIAWITNPSPHKLYTESMRQVS